MRTGREIIEEAFKLHNAGDLPGAERLFDRLLAYSTEPDANVLLGYGTLLAQKERFGLAINLLEQAIETLPDYTMLWMNYGVCLKNAGRAQAAIEAFKKSIELDPNNGEAYSNYAGCFINMGCAEQGVPLAKRAIELLPDYPNAHNHLAMLLLELGRLEEAWPHYDYRWTIPERIHFARPYKAPEWHGEYVKGTLAIHGEQGLGDEIMFLGCLREVQKRADRIICEVSPRLVSWFQKNWPEIKFYGTHEELIAANGEPEKRVAIASLARWVGMPNGKPYIKRLDRSIPRRVGIAWRGGTERTNKKERSLRLGSLKPILDVPGYEFISVQYGEPGILDEAKRHGIELGADNKDAVDIAHWISTCDLIISPCQTAIHQAGAMGVETWVMTPTKCAWRYCGYGEKMPWYESVKLYRQKTADDWKPVIQRIADDLRRR